MFGDVSGRKLETGDPRLGSTVYSGLTPADEYRLKIARQNFIAADVGDFDRNGKDFVDRASGKRYRLVKFDPTMSGDRLACSERPAS